MTRSHLNGWIILDKPSGLSSAHAVGMVKRLLKPHAGGKLKIGHAGTLDPLASGVLPLALGEATKTVGYMMDGAKAYEFTVQWGSATDTDDSEGQVTRTSDKRPSDKEINNILQHFIGELDQMPPQYSALKVDGKRAYALARDGKKADLKPRKIYIERLEVVEGKNGKASRPSEPSLSTEALAKGEACPMANSGECAGGIQKTTFLCHCGKGTYIRSLARDMGEQLGCYGHITMLRRTKVGKFTENHAFSLDLLTEMVHKGDLSFLLAVESALDDIPALEIAPSQATDLQQGRSLPWPGTSHEVALARSGGTAVALCRVADGQMKPVRVFNL
ncbi:MAG: tRNA pseudouridine(55) synthase TruB [Alphaproteobacteria bacterium]